MRNGMIMTKYDVMECVIVNSVALPIFVGNQRKDL